MNKVITVNLNGNAYQLEEDGYHALRVYLEGAGQRLSGNPDRDEIIGDIEQAIADKFRAAMGKFKSVVEARDVLAVIAEMGPVNDDPEAPETTSARPPSGSSDEQKTQEHREIMTIANPTASATGDSAQPARRLYKIPDGAIVAGVCNGVAAYLSLDVVLLRLGFVIFSIVVGLSALLVHWFILLPFLLYTVLALTLPTANTEAEKVAARGDPATAQQYIRRAKQGYYNSLKNFTEATQGKDWRHRYKREMRAQARQYQASNYSSPAWSGAVTPGFVIPLLILAEIVVFFIWLGGLFSLVTHQSAFGIALPPDIPIWIGLIVMIFVLHVVLWPLRALKHGCYAAASGQRSYDGHHGFFDSLVSLAAFGAAIWLADHYIPAVHEFFLTLPARIDSAAQAINASWSHR